MNSTLTTVDRSMRKMCLMGSGGGFGTGHRCTKGTGSRGSLRGGAESFTQMDPTMWVNTRTGSGMVSASTTKRQL